MQRCPELRCERAKRSDFLMMHIERVWQTNWQVYGANKVWRQMNRKGIVVARCTLEQLMRQLGLQGAHWEKKVRTTISDSKAPCTLDRVNRVFKAERPNQLWKSDFTYVSTWQGWLYVAFVIDVYADVLWVGAYVAACRRISFLMHWSRRSTTGSLKVPNLWSIIRTVAPNTFRYSTPSD